MCYFVTWIFPKDCDTDGILPVLKTFGRTFIPLNNPVIWKQLLLGEQYGLSKQGQCDCGTCFGASQRNTSIDKPGQIQLIEKMRKRGWSETKLKRWIEQNRNTEFLKQQHWQRGQTSLLARSKKMDPVSERTIRN